MASITTTIESIPEEILLTVFSYLSPTFLCDTVAEVCMHWEDLCKDPLLYKSLEFCNDNVDTETAIKLLRRAPLLKSLKLVNVKNMETILGEVSQHNRKIRFLCLGKHREPYGIESAVLETVMDNCTEIKNLQLHGCIVDLRGFEFLSNLCQQLPRLKRLYFDLRGTYSCASEVMHLSDSCLDLEELVINDCSRYSTSNSEHPSIIALCKRYSKTLRYFTVNSGVWTRESFSALKTCERLGSLCITNSRSMSNEAMPTIASIPTLRQLALINCKVPETVWNRLFTSGAWTKLRWLDLGASNVTDDVCVAIGDRLKNLRTVALDGKGQPTLTARGLKSVIQGCSKLRVIFLENLEHTYVEVCQYITGRLPRLGLLTASGARLGSIDMLKACMPELFPEHNSD